MEGRVINIDPEILGGNPVFFGTRVPIKNLFNYLETNCVAFFEAVSIVERPVV